MKIEVNDQFDKSSKEAHAIDMLIHWVGQLESMGLVVEVSRKPLQPLAQGNHAPVVDVRRARVLAK